MSIQKALGRTKRIRDTRLGRETNGGVVALVALFLPIAILCIGMVVDLGAVFFVRKAVQSACDLGALAGVQELDWDALGQGMVLIQDDDATRIAKKIALKNLESVGSLIFDCTIFAEVDNFPVTGEPTVTVKADYGVMTPFLKNVPGLSNGFDGSVLARASVVKRTKW